MTKILAAAAVRPTDAPSPRSTTEPDKNILALPADVLTGIFFHAPFADIRALRAVSHNFRQAASRPDLLKKKFAEAGLPVPRVSKDNTSFSWHAGLRLLRIRNNLANGRHVLKKIHDDQAAHFYPPQRTPSRQTQVDQLALSLPPSLQGASIDGSLYAYSPIGVHPPRVQTLNIARPGVGEQTFTHEYLGFVSPAFSHDNLKLAVATSASEVVIRKLEDGSQTTVRCFKNESKSIASLALSTDGSKLAVLLCSHGWRFDIQMAARFRELGSAQRCTVSALKRTLLRKDSVLRVFDLTPSLPARRLETRLALGDEGICAQLAFSPDDSRLLCDTYDSPHTWVWDFEAPGRRD